MDVVDQSIARWLARYSLPFLRVGMGVVFLWFGALKFMAGMSPAEDLALRTIDALTFGLIPASVSLVLLAGLESAIGLGFLTGRFTRVTLALLAFQMAGALSPLALFPGEVFERFPYAPTLEGQYIVKNLVLIGAGLVIGATVRGGRLVAEPDDCPEPGSRMTTRPTRVDRSRRRPAARLRG
jgi:uncharacterized membrane protein YphA (DoxX/SURF4 family)